MMRSRDYASFRHDPAGVAAMILKVAKLGDMPARILAGEDSYEMGTGADACRSASAARQFNTTPKTVAKWVERFRAEGVDGLRDRSSRPLSLPSQTAPATCAAVEALRR